MIRLFLSFVQLALMRIAPQDLPASMSLFWPAALAYVGVGVVMLVDQLDTMTTMGVVLLDTLLILGLVRWQLRLRKLHNRELQTYTAVLGAGAILGLVSWPVVAWFAPALMAAEAEVWVMLIYMLLMTWNLMLLAHIMRHALSATLGVGLVFAMGYMFLSVLLRSLLFPYQ